MKNILRFVLIAFSMWISNAAFTEEVHKNGSKSADVIKETAAGCAAGSSYKYLDINNVRTLMYSYGNGWFLELAEYEIPKGSKKTSMFSTSLWIGGIDVNNNLKLAAYRYGQGPTTATAHSKNDFWPGPLTVDGTAAIDAETCSNYDKLYPMTRTEVQEFLAWWSDKAAYPDYVIPKSILDWPAHGDRSKGQAFYLAPFYDVNGDGIYDPRQGDYPYYDLANVLCPKNLKPGELIARAKIKNGEPSDTMGILVDQVLKGDQTLWSVYNDKGNYHSETTGDPIGMEIRAQYFAFATNDEINNMTFYSYEIINRSTYTLTGTYFSQWVDPDLGYANDDYVGCDVNRGLGYCYNGTPVDGTGQSYAYGLHPPAVGVDFFQGPYMDPDGYDNPSYKGSTLKGPSFKGSCDIVGMNGTVINMSYGPDEMYQAPFMVRSDAINGINFGDGIKDNERFGMRRFVYHNNSNAGVPNYMTDPNYASEYYLFLRGIWKDNTKMSYGGNANISQGGAYGPDCDFMFPDETDICDWGTKGQPPNGPKKWTEVLAGNNPQDRRFMQSAGPFTLLPGACNYITVGIPWARSISGTPEESVALLKIVDDKCQNLFDNCFAVLSGPNAPDLTFEEMDKELIVYISNRKTNDAGNNYNERYVEFDPNIPNPDTLPHNNRNDSLYHFEGYQIYQLKDATVSAADIDDESKARLVAQVDVQNGVTKLVNWTYDQNLGGNKGEVMVNGADKGIRHSFVFTKDMFATGNDRLINHKQYYYVAVAYAYNEYKKYNGLDPTALDGQKTPYLRGRSNIKTYTAIPHIPLGEIMHSTYGEGPVITRLQGQGNGGMVIEFTEATITEILSKPPADSLNVYGGPDYPICYNPTYLVNQGPLQVKVIDPLNVVNAEYTVKFDSMVAVTPGNPFTNKKKIQFGKWSLTNNNTGVTYQSDTTTIYAYEQIFLDLGIALTLYQVPNPGDSLRGSVTADNGLLWAPTAIYEDSTKIWLGGVPDSDVPESFENWIRSGTYKGADTRFYDWNMGSGATGQPWDPNKNFQKIQNGTWAPYCLTAINADELYVGPASGKRSKLMATMDNLCSVDIVITPDKSKWSRCPVVELCPKTALAQGGAKIFDFRKSPSVNVDGDTGVVSMDPLYDSKYINETGMGWFPGYAINLETGERLNIMFGENSWLVADSGRDMRWNPSSRLYDAGGIPVFGGQHYVYVMNHKSIVVANIHLDYPAYDGGAYIRKIMLKTPSTIYKDNTYAMALYVTIPLAIPGKEFLSNTVINKIRVSKPYKRYYSEKLPYDSTGLNPDTLNRNYPVYAFSTASIATSKNNVEKATSDLDLINVVPNPYYAYDDYERNQLDNRIKIVNLPTKCSVTIFDMSGTMIRQFTVDKSGIPEPRSSISGLDTDAKTSIDWDLKNFAGIPIAGGVYLIHVKADGLGERTIKWFGILRPVDLNAL